MIPSTLAPVAAHLWQSTLFAAVAALLTLALRRNQARVRYWLWLAASCKFLIPFSWLVSVGHLFQWRVAPAPVLPAFTALTDTIAAPVFLIPSPAAQPAPNHLPTILLAICTVWACGFVVVATGWIREWLRIRAMVRAASPLPFGLTFSNPTACHSGEHSDEESLLLSSLASREILRFAQNDTPKATCPVRVVSTAAHIEPGVFGVFRPVLVLPDGIGTRLTRSQLQAVLAHELCHVRRRDNLTAALHMLVEAAFWFYPLVWWLGARMIDERERACDEEVLRAGSEAQAYAESILKVCEFYLESPLTCISGVTGSNLKKRIHRIMKEHFGVALSPSKKLLLATAGTAALIIPIVVGVMTAPELRAQSLAAQAPTGRDASFVVPEQDQNQALQAQPAATAQALPAGDSTGDGPFEAGTHGVGYPKCLYCPPPQYPEQEHNAKVQGEVDLTIVVQPDGHPTDIKVISGVDGLNEKAIETVKTWRFQPALGPDGKPVAAIAPIKLSFQVLEHEPSAAIEIASDPAQPAKPAGQSPSAPPAFEVTSVKPLPPGDRSSRFVFLPGGRLVSTAGLQFVISFAYNLPFNPSARLIGAPEWIFSPDARYDIEATGVFPDGLSEEARRDRERLMVQALLADRFKLVIHREVKELPVYALVVAKGGPKLQKADIEEKDCPDPSATPAPDPKTLCHTLLGGRGRGFYARAVSISELANGVENYTDRPVVDKTGIEGLYHIETTPWRPIQAGPPPAPGARAEDGTFVEDLPTTFEVFEKLGLKMEPEKDNVDVYVIDHIEEPSPN